MLRQRTHVPCFHVRVESIVDIEPHNILGIRRIAIRRKALEADVGLPRLRERHTHAGQATAAGPCCVLIEACIL